MGPAARRLRRFQDVSGDPSDHQSHTPRHLRVMVRLPRQLRALGAEACFAVIGPVPLDMFPAPRSRAPPPQPQRTAGSSGASGHGDQHLQYCHPAGANRKLLNCSDPRGSPPRHPANSPSQRSTGPRAQSRVQICWVQESRAPFSTSTLLKCKAGNSLRCGPVCVLNDAEEHPDVFLLDAMSIPKVGSCKLAL